MAAIGYAPLPPQLSQFLADAVGYMTGQPAQQLNASNCSNPTFSGSLGAGASPPPLPPIGNAPGGAAGSRGTGVGTGSQALGTTATGCASSTTTTTTSKSSTTTTTKPKSEPTTTTSTTALCQSSGSGSGSAGTSNAQIEEASNLKAAAPAALGGGQLPTSPLLPLLALLVLLAAPVVVLSIKRSQAKSDESVEPDDSTAT
jgi:phosphate transport system substrate-binding protein